MSSVLLRDKSDEGMTSLTSAPNSHAFNPTSSILESHPNNYTENQMDNNAAKKLYPSQQGSLSICNSSFVPSCHFID